MMEKWERFGYNIWLVHRFLDICYLIPLVANSLWLKEAQMSPLKATWMPATTLLMLESRFLGALETQAGPGALFRDGFFWTTDKLGVAQTVFLKGAVPRVPRYKGRGG